MTSQPEAVQRVWLIAGVPPTTGSAATFPAMAVATNRTLAATVATVDLDDADSVANPVEELLQWRQRRFRATS